MLTVWQFWYPEPSGLAANMPILSYARCSPVEASSKSSCWSFVTWQGQLARNDWDINPLHNTLSILTSCQTSECAWYSYGASNEANPATSVACQVEYRPAGLIFAPKLSFMTGHRKKMCRTPPLFLVQIKVTQDLNNSVWSCDSMRSKFCDFASQKMLTQGLFSLHQFSLLHKNNQSQCVMFGSQYNAVWVSLFEYHYCKKTWIFVLMLLHIFLVSEAELWSKKEGR